MTTTKIATRTVIGRTAFAEFPNEGIKKVPVKIDTGADSSSIWASELEVTDDGILCYKLFAKGSKYFSGEVHKVDDYDIRLIRSSNGTSQVRYRVPLTIKLGGRTVKGSFTLADRSKNTYPILVGSRLLKNKFLVDVSLGDPLPRKRRAKSTKYTTEFQKDPRAFFEKYHAKNQRGDLPT